MKVLMTTDAIGGVWTYSLELARGLQQYDVEILLVCFGNKLTEEQRAEVSGIQNVTFICKPYKLEWMQEPWEEVDKAGRFLLRLAKRFQPDVVHLNNLVHAHLPFKAPVANVVHSCVVSWWQAVHNTLPPHEWDEYIGRVRVSLQHADMVIAPSNTMLEAADYHYGPFQRKEVVYNSSSMKSADSPERKPIIFSMGRLWDKAKNIELLLKAAPLIDADIYIAGDHKFDGIDLPTNVNLLHKLPPRKVQKWLSGASLYVLPVKYEPFGLTFLEAALSGCAIVTGDIPSMHEVWDNTVSYADTDDAMALADICNTLLSNKEQCQQQAKRSKRHAQKYLWPTMASQYHKHYSELIDKRPDKLLASPVKMLTI